MCPFVLKNSFICAIISMNNSFSKGGVYMYSDRLSLYQELEAQFKSKLLVYVTSDRRGLETQIAQDVIDLFIEHLDSIGPVPKISLYLYTRGGDTAAAWNIINLIKIYCDELEVIIPHKAHSAGTLISIGANKIIMTKQATLGPIDPSINTPLNPMINNGQNYPVSVEAVKGYIALAKEEMNVKDDEALADVLVKLSEKVHPLVLGQVYRTRAQIQMLAKKLLPTQVSDDDKVNEIINFLCSDSGSHDYTINRREAKETLGLKVEKPTDEQYRIIKAVYDDISKELEFGKIFDPRNLQGSYSLRRGIIESLTGGCDVFVSDGVAKRVQAPNGQIQIVDERSFEGWKHEEIANGNI